MSQPDPFAEYLRAVVASAALVREMERAHVLAELDAEARAYVAPAALVPGELVVAAMPGAWTSRPFWLVADCACDLCALGRHVAVDQPFDGGWRHISRAALRRRGETSGKEAERWADMVTQLDGAARMTESGHDTGFGPLTAWLAEMAAASTGQTPC